MDAPAILLILGSYLIGAVPSAYWLARAIKGIDIRRYGSGNVGISNFATHVGKWWAVPLVLFDVLVKGMLPVLLASGKVLDLGIEIEAAAGAAAIIGHNWSVFLKFAGGRGMATVLGVLGTFSFPLVVLYGAVPFVGWNLTGRRDSAMWWGLAAAVLPLWSLLLGLPAAVTWFCVGFLLVTAFKRLTSNHSTDRVPPDRGAPLGRLVWNRLVFDRDIDSRREWVHRKPGSRVG